MVLVTQRRRRVGWWNLLCAVCRAPGRDAATGLMRLSRHVLCRAASGRIAWARCHRGPPRLLIVVVACIWMSCICAVVRCRRVRSGCWDLGEGTGREREGEGRGEEIARGGASIGEAHAACALDAQGCQCMPWAASRAESGQVCGYSVYRRGYSVTGVHLLSYCGTPVIREVWCMCTICVGQQPHS